MPRTEIRAPITASARRGKKKAKLRFKVGK